jgi:hypothetical protein
MSHGDRRGNGCLNRGVYLGIEKTGTGGRGRERDV